MSESVTDERLGELLRRADDAAPVLPAVPDNLASRVRHVADARRKLSQLRGVVAMLLVVVSATVMFGLRGQRREETPPANIARQAVPLTSPASLPQQSIRSQRDSDEAEWHARLAARMNAEARRTRRLTQLRRLSAAADPIDMAHVRLDQAAYLIMDEADRLADKPERTADAAASYCRLLELFPRSRWAGEARRKLEVLKIRCGAST